MSRLSLAVALILVIGVTIMAQPAGPAADRVALVNANVVNVLTGAVQDGQTLMLAGGRIQSVGTAAPPAGVRVVNLANRWVVPGLIDAHVHIASLPEMRAALQSGVTTARSAGVSSYADVGLRELVKKGYVAGPDLLAAGYHVRTFPAPELFLTDPDLGDLIGGVTTVDAIRRVVRANLAHGVDWIKIYTTQDVVGQMHMWKPDDTLVASPSLTLEEVEAIVDEAHRLGLKVACHTYGGEGMNSCLTAGVDAPNHLLELDDAGVKTLVQKKLPFVVTLDDLNAIFGPFADEAVGLAAGQVIREVHRPDQGGVDLAAPERLDGGVQGVQSRAVAAGEGERRPAEAELAGDPAGGDARQAAHDAVGVQRGDGVGGLGVVL